MAKHGPWAFAFNEPAPFDLHFQEAIEWFAEKGLTISPDSWRGVWRQENARAFTVARVTMMDVLTSIMDETRKAIDTGTTVEEFKRSLIPMLEATGWWTPEGERAVVEMPDGTIRKRLAPWRLDLIYRTNVRSAYAVGRYQQLMATAEQRPLWMYMHDHPAVPRESHLAMHGKVYDYRHPFWDTWYPPNGFGCKCYVKSLSLDEAREMGIEPETSGVSEEPDEGWDYNAARVGLDSWQPDLGKYSETLAREFLIEASAKALNKAISKLLPASASTASSRDLARELVDMIKRSSN